MFSNIPFSKKIHLLIVDFWINQLNFWLSFFQKIFFRKIKTAPQNILIYKIGNIGDIVCAIPAFIAIRRAYPMAKITLLTSPGKRGALGAKELLDRAWYLDELKVYYAEDLDSFDKKKIFIRDLKRNNYDLFIQLPDDLANFRILFRNMTFAKLIGVKSAIGFKIRTIQLFKKTQVDYSANKTEAESLLDILYENDIYESKVEFDFNIADNQKNKVKTALKEKWGEISKDDIIIAISAGGKRETSQWPKERFREVAEYLCKKYNVKIIIVGGRADVSRAKLIAQNLKNEDYLIVAGELEILETAELLKSCSFLISNSTGIIHLAAAAGLPAIGIYSIRDVFGRWFPYGKNHKILYHKFLNCDYKNENCIKKSIGMISVEEIKIACDTVIKKIN